MGMRLCGLTPKRRRHRKPSKSMPTLSTETKEKDTQMPSGPGGRSAVPCSGGCPPDCGHSEMEHYAFDAGLSEGERSGVLQRTPEVFHESNLREAFNAGQSVGIMNHKEAIANVGTLASRWSAEDIEDAHRIVNDIAERCDNRDSAGALRQALEIYADLLNDERHRRNETNMDHILKFLEEIKEQQHNK